MGLGRTSSGGCDTKELAKQLIARFGAFAEVVNAPDQRLKEIF